MNKNEYYKSLAHDTWPQFERKMRRAKRLKRIQKWLPFVTFLLITIFIVRYFTLNDRTKNSEAALNQKHQILKKVQVHQLVENLDSQRKLRLQQSKVTSVLDFLKVNPELIALERLPNQSIQLFSPSSIGSYQSADLTIALAQLNLMPVSWSLQSNAHSLAALLDEHTLLIMNLMYGEEPLLAVPSDFSGDCWYRPSFFPSNMFVQLSFYDVSDWIQDPLSVRITVNRSENPVLLPRRYTRSNSVVIPGTASRVYTAYDRENPGTFFYRTQSMLSPALKKARYHTLIYYADRPAVSFNPYLFHRSDTLVVLSAQAQRMTLLSMNGTVLASKQIEFKGRGLHALKRKEFLYDPVRNEIYIVAPSNFHFIFFKLDLQTGVAQEVYQTPTVWKGAEFEIRDQQLSYLYKEDLIDVLLKSH
jgi:hypothetical protein